MADAPVMRIDEARALWRAVVAVASATLYLRQASDAMNEAFGSAVPAASAHLLLEAAHGLTMELGESFRGLAAAEDAEVREYGAMMRARLAHEPSAVPVPKGDS